jgi:ankyrin repeat protein
MNPSEERSMSDVAELHEAVKYGDLAGIRKLLDVNRALANSRSVTDARGTYPLHVAAEFGQAAAARLLLEYGADVSLLDDENAAVALCCAAFFGRSEVVAVLLAAGSPPSQRTRHGLTPLGCAVGGQAGRWRSFSNATLEDWGKAADITRSYGGAE